jgi:hypothetical protein
MTRYCEHCHKCAVSVKAWQLFKKKKLSFLELSAFLRLIRTGVFNSCEFVKIPYVRRVAVWKLLPALVLYISCAIRRHSSRNIWLLTECHLSPDIRYGELS